MIFSSSPSLAVFDSSALSVTTFLAVSSLSVTGMGSTFSFFGGASLAGSAFASTGFSATAFGFSSAGFAGAALDSKSIFPTSFGFF